MRSKSIKKDNKDNRINLRLNDKQFKYISELAEFYNCDKSFIVRQMIDYFIIHDKSSKEVNR